MTIEQVAEFYNGCESIKETARYFAVSEQKIKRFLITAGVYENEQSRAVIDLYKAGFTPEEIGERLKLSKSAVFSHLPYIKGQYMSDTPSKNAVRIRKCRERARREQDVEGI